MCISMFRCESEATCTSSKQSGIPVAVQVRPYTQSTQLEIENICM